MYCYVLLRKKVLRIFLVFPVAPLFRCLKLLLKGSGSELS